MKKITILLIAFLLLPIVYDRYFSDTPVLQKKLPFTDKTTITTSEKMTISHEGNTYAYYYFSPNKDHHLIYNLNLTNKLTSVDIIKRQKCTLLINGGFYDREDQPIGLVIKDGLEISPSQKNILFNGYLSASSSADFYISTTKPSLESIVAIQTGPILIDNFELQNLKLITDEYKRRMVLINTESGGSVFMSITLEKNEIEGPLLEALPSIVSKISKKENFQAVKAINLDGGSASTFYTPEVHIKEISSIGSYLCFKQP